MRKKILIAAGGTGGHLFPAQLLARELKEKESELEIFFGGNRLSSNPFFDKNSFDFREINSSSPFQNPVTSTFHLGRGTLQSFSLFSQFRPNLVIGFGSFYSFPLLMAAYLKKIPYILVESNGFPGKVNRLFSSKALFSALQFEEAKTFLKGRTKQAAMPFPTKHSFISKEEARKFYGLDPNLFTLLIFGGSQGAQPINEAASSLELDFPYQVLHFGGEKEILEEKYKEKGILACVKPFERQMHIAWRGSDLAICRAGAATLTEMIQFHVPAILIPWPKSAEQHQQKNAKIAQALGGALLLEQDNLSNLPQKIAEAKERIDEMKQSLQKFQKQKALSDIILQEIST